jgi:hypothetical protein
MNTIILQEVESEGTNLTETKHEGLARKGKERRSMFEDVALKSMRERPSCSHSCTFLIHIRVCTRSCACVCANREEEGRNIP